MDTKQGRLSRLRLGDLLTTRRLVTAEQLQEGLVLAEARSCRLGEALMELNHLAESDLKTVLALQLGLAYEGGHDFRLEHAEARLLSEQIATDLKVLPLRMEGNTLVVATVDPLNFQALEHVALKCGRQVRPVVVTTATFQRAMVKVFGLPELNRDDLHSQSYEIGQDEENPTARLVNTLLAQALTTNASDIHLEPLEDQIRVRYRVDGTLLEMPPLPLSRHTSLIARLKVMAGMDIAERRIPQDGQINVSHRDRRVDMRINTVPTVHGERMVIRLLDRNQGVRSLEQLGLPGPEERLYRSMIARPNGLILVTGPTGSGKSTTLMSTLNTLNKPGVNILTIEDPVEYHVKGISQVQINPKAGLSFSTGLRSFLRQDPDVIMVGEIRDQETADIAIRAALTGHLVFSTLHTNQAAGAVSRLVDMGVEPFLLATALLGVVAQRLVRVLCGRCKEAYMVADDDPLRLMPDVPPGPLTLYRARGCGFCDHAGYKGRVAIFELLPVTGAVRELISQRATTAALQAEAMRLGFMRTLWQTGFEKAITGHTSMEEVQKVAFAEA